MATGTAPADHRSALAELLFARRLGRMQAGLSAIGIVVAAMAASDLLLAAQHRAIDDADVRIWGRLVANGSSLATAWPGWAAAVCFLVASRRFAEAPEPPMSRQGRQANASAAELRAGLRTEYRLTRLLLCGLVLASVMECARILVDGVATTMGDVVARADLFPTGVEGLGWTAAATALARWLWCFRAQLIRLGALGPEAQAARLPAATDDVVAEVGQNVTLPAATNDLEFGARGVGKSTSERDGTVGSV